jgi:hypothetical protein
MATKPDDPEGREWIDPAEAEARAEKTSKHAHLLAEVEQRAAEWWDRIDSANHFRDRWNEVTGRAS